jgi:hypothetical protein
MSLPTLTYKYIGKFNSPAVTISGTMAALSNAFASTTYSDGSSRVAGSGVAWTPTTQLSSSIIIAVGLTPVTSTLGQKIIYAGGVVSGAPTMISPDVYTSARTIFGICKNAGSFGSWTDANPFTTGQFSGYTGFGNAVSAIHAYESQDTLMVIGETSTGTTYLSIAGAMLDPESSNASTAESDGKIYCLSTTGYNNPGGTPHAYLNFGNNSLFRHLGTAGNSHTYYMNFGTNSVTTLTRFNVAITSPSAVNTLKNLGSEFVRLPIYLENGSSLFCGRVREMLMFSSGLCATKLTVSGVTSGFIVGGSTVSVAECIFLKA